MRGLTALERALCEDAAIPSPISKGLPQHDAATDQELAVYATLVARGCVVTVTRESLDSEWEWEEWLITELGRMALRVCPVGEVLI